MLTLGHFTRIDYRVTRQGKALAAPRHPHAAATCCNLLLSATFSSNMCCCLLLRCLRKTSAPSGKGRPSPVGALPATTTKRAPVGKGRPSPVGAQIATYMRGNPPNAHHLHEGKPPVRWRALGGRPRCEAQEAIVAAAAAADVLTVLLCSTLFYFVLLLLLLLRLLHCGCSDGHEPATEHARRPYAPTPPQASRNSASALSVWLIPVAVSIANGCLVK